MKKSHEWRGPLPGSTASRYLRSEKKKKKTQFLHGKEEEHGRVNKEPGLHQ
jgi:hypothetical protein